MCSCAHQPSDHPVDLGQPLRTGLRIGLARTLRLASVGLEIGTVFDALHGVLLRNASLGLYFLGLALSRPQQPLRVREPPHQLFRPPQPPHRWHLYGTLAECLPLLLCSCPRLISVGIHRSRQAPATPPAASLFRHHAHPRIAAATVPVIGFAQA
jgi:hypothetical protein